MRSATRTNVIRTRSHQQIRVNWTDEHRWVTVHFDRVNGEPCTVEVQSNHPAWLPFVKLPAGPFDEDDFERIVDAARKGLDVYSAHFD